MEILLSTQFLEDLWQSFVNNFHQEEEVTFHPEMVASNFLHAILVVRPTPEGYKIAMVTRWEQPPTPPSPREDVPDFGPQLSGDTAHPANRGLRWVGWLPQQSWLNLILFWQTETSCIDQIERKSTQTYIFRRSILAKLINAEQACYKSRCSINVYSCKQPLFVG